MRQRLPGRRGEKRKDKYSRVVHDYILYQGEVPNWSRQSVKNGRAAKMIERAKPCDGKS